jgi:hypothetical protein
MRRLWVENPFKKWGGQGVRRVLIIDWVCIESSTKLIIHWVCEIGEGKRWIIIIWIWV